MANKLGGSQKNTRGNKRKEHKNRTEKDHITDATQFFRWWMKTVCSTVSQAELRSMRIKTENMLVSVTSIKSLLTFARAVSAMQRTETRFFFFFFKYEKSVEWRLFFQNSKQKVSSYRLVKTEGSRQGFFKRGDNQWHV